MKVYFIQSGIKGPIKIGVANNVESRLKFLQTGCPEKLSLIIEIICKSRKHAFEIEKQLHKRFGFLRLNGEWFKPRIKGMISQIREIPEECIIKHHLK